MAPFLALTGFMGSGKSSVGAEVASRLGWRFVDLDEEFVREVEVSITDFFAAHGEAAFRERECRLLRGALAEVRGESGLVVALGGGTLETPEAASMLAGRGGVVFLDVDPAGAWSRVVGTGRPLAMDSGQFKGLLARRRKTYEDVSDWVIPVRDRGIAELAQEVVTLVRDAGDHWQGLWGRRLVSTERPSFIVGGKKALSMLRSRASAVHSNGQHLFVFTDKNVMDAWGEAVWSLLEGGDSDAALVVEPGEVSKNVETLERCWGWLAERGARRDDVVVALGGGVIGDLAGFAAATYQRGVPLWQIPTSLLAQVDSSVGGKTAVNLAAGKNLVGAFYQPDLVVIDPEMLGSLPGEEYVAGLGEVVKYSLLISAEFFASLERDSEAVLGRDVGSVARVVRSCVAYKAGVVEEDERESGRRAVLNLGHTLAHALEVVEGYGSFRHGEAVSLGLLVSLAVSERLLGLEPGVRERTRSLLSAFGLPTTTRLPSAEALLAAAGHDKKVRAGSSGFVGLRGIAAPVCGLDVPSQVLIQALEVIRE